MRIVPSLLSTAIVVAPLSTPVVADELTDMLKKIKDTGTITLGHRDASIPLSYLGIELGKLTSYSRDLQLKVVEVMKEELSLLDLRTRYSLVTSQARIPLVRNSTADIECSPTTNNEECQRQVDLSVGIFKAGTRPLSKKAADIKDPDDLKGKNVVTTVGTIPERLLKAMGVDKKVGMNIISTKDHGESLMMPESGRAVAFMMDGTLLYDEMVKAKEPDDQIVGGAPQPSEAYGCMVCRGDAAFKKVVDKAIIDAHVSGEVSKIYDKWSTQPIPSRGLNLNLPMSKGPKKLIASLTDKAAGQM